MDHVQFVFVIGSHAGRVRRLSARDPKDLNSRTSRRKLGEGYASPKGDMIGTLRQFVEVFVKKTFDCLHAERPVVVGFCALSASSRFVSPRTVAIATLLSLALIGSAIAPAQAADGGRPAIGSASPHELARNARLVVKGRGFVAGAKHNVILFRGGPGGS